MIYWKNGRSAGALVSAAFWAVLGLYLLDLAGLMLRLVGAIR